MVVHKRTWLAWRSRKHVDNLDKIHTHKDNLMLTNLMLTNVMLTNLMLTKIMLTNLMCDITKQSRVV